MKRMAFFRPAVLIAGAIFLTGPVLAQDTSKSPQADASKLVYADFQNSQNGRPMSNRGGTVRLNRWSSNPANPPEYHGMEKADPPAPALARVTENDVAAAFEYEMRIPNEWEGVSLEIYGQPEKDGKPLADDVSGYKFITFRLFAKGPRQVRLELITRGYGANLESGYPMANIQVSPGFNTYKLKLGDFNQPDWARPLDLKQDVLKKLTSVTIGVNCDKCTIEKGTVVVDNIAFEK